MEDLESILSTDTPSSDQSPPAPDLSGQPRDEHGRFASTDQTGDGKPDILADQQAAPPAAPQEPQDHIPVAALKDERQKRQQLEAQLQEYQNYFQALQQQQNQPQVQAPDPNVDFNGWLNWRDQQIAAQIRESVMGEVQNYGNQVTVMNRAQVSEALARQRHEDYDKVIDGSFSEAVQANPNIVTLLARDPDPASFAYRTAKQWEQAKSLGNSEPVDRAQIEAQVRAQIMSELGLSNKQAPSSLASERSVSVPRSGVAWGGPTDLGDILGTR